MAARSGGDDREIVLDLSAHPKRDEVLYFHRGRVTLESQNYNANFHLSKKKREEEKKRTAVCSMTVTREVKC